MYLKESTALQIVCRNKLKKLRLEKYSDTATFFSDFEKSVNELKSACAKISEKEKLNYMLNTVPSQYSDIGYLIDTLKEEDQTALYVKNKIQIAEMKNNSEYRNKSQMYSQGPERKLFQMWKKRAFRTRMPKWRTSRTKRHNMARINSWPQPRKRRKRQLRQRARKLPSARSQHDRAKRLRYERMDSSGARGVE